MTMDASEPGGTEEGLVKLTFPLDPQEWHGSATETLWAEPLAAGEYRLRNTPFYAHGISAEDVVFAREEDGRLWFAGVARHGGRSTYRLIPSAGVAPAHLGEHWDPLQRLGCSYEEGPGRLLAVDVPPEADIQAVYELLELGEQEQLWEFEEGHCGHPLP